MCGLFGIVDQSKQKVQQEWLDAGIASVAHRGPDGVGSFRHEQVGLAHCRLAIVDLTEKGKQPMHYGDLTIVYNGMIYNYLELREELMHLGYRFESQTDTEVILAAYQHWGMDCTKYFNGMWAFAIYDQSKKRLFCARDRFGIKPFYYTQLGALFCFASEIKQLTQLPFWKAQYHPGRAYEFLAWGYHDHTSNTLFEGVKQLRGGQQLVYELRRHTYSISYYYQVPYPTSKLSIDFVEASTQFRELLNDAIRLRLRADVPTGTALSGGLDSSTIVCLIHAQRQKTKNSASFESVSACFADSRYDEQVYMDSVAQQTAVRIHKVFPNFEDCWAGFDQINWQQDEPTAGASVFAQQEVFRHAAKAGLRVMLDGQGADELLAGYEKFYLPHFQQLFRRQPLEGMGQLIQFVRLHHIGPKAIWRRFSQYRQRQRGEGLDWLKVDFQALDLYRRPNSPSISDISNQLINDVGLPVLLHYEDRNAMAFGVESRLPFLDDRLVEFCLQLPDHFKINKAQRKYILREAMKGILPDKIRTRYDKMAFATPQQQWMQTHQALFQEKLKQAVERSGGLFGKTILRADYQSQWRVLAFDSWMQQFNVQNTLQR
ncbi:MAG: asparagine synthase (glutamine-hydrolyzing) [Bacteroidota bacterium]